MMSKKSPQLRFEGFTDNWEERKLGDITKISTGKLDANAMVENGKYDFYTSGIKKYRIDVAAFEGPSITIAGNGATVGYMHLADNKFNAYQRTYVLQEFLVDRSFIFSEIGNKLPKKIKQEARTGNIPYIVMDMLTELKLLIPQNNSEQQKIGSFFKQLDETIALHQRKLDLLKEQKKGYLQKMFPKNRAKVPELRFAGFTDAWEQRKLGEVSSKVTEKNKETNFKETLTNSAEYGIINQRDFFDKDISNEKNLNSYYIVRPDDFVYNPRISNSAPVGPIKRNKLGRTGVMSPLYYVFRVQGVDKTYLEKYFSANGWHKFMKLNGDSGARSDRFSIKDSVFREMPIPVPSEDEQIQIGSFLNKLDQAITLHQLKLDLLKEQKKGFLQKMFA